MQSVAAALDRLSELAASPTVATLADAFEAAGHELALVGGPVRDAFLGRGTNDLDFTTDATPDEILAVVKPIAEAHWDIGRAFGTIGAKSTATPSRSRPTAPTSTTATRASPRSRSAPRSSTTSTAATSR